ncbi:hypothetical protein CEXT_314911 [Caerostris extrusa]|uniref:Ycf15 n=1 Tax=Caerostris extrusa TaxID=172846 RepID=A0AAV4UP06_CAEEX|nr:hypothetical protein CEXT_314911 [Caerostris extrusa]
MLYGKDQPSSFTVSSRKIPPRRVPWPQRQGSSRTLFFPGRPQNDISVPRILIKARFLCLSHFLNKREEFTLIYSSEDSVQVYLF